MKKPSKNATAPQSATKSALPYEFADSVMWAAWLYFVDEWTQSAIAEKIGVSRVTVIKMLNEAKARGLVNVQMSPKAAAHVKLSRKIAEKYSLNSVTIIPDAGSEPLVPRLGKAGAFALEEAIVKDDIVGVAWGRTVLSVANSIAMTEPVDNVTIVQICGSSNGISTDFSPELCSSLMANKLGARNVGLLAPATVSSAQLRDLLLAEPSIVRQFEVIRSSNRVVFGVGDLGQDATIRDSELHSQETINEVINRGAIGVLIGRFIDDKGEEVISPTDDRMIGISLDELKAIPYRLCVAGGAIKTECIIAALKGSFATDLVTSQATAEAMMASQH